MKPADLYPARIQILWFWNSDSWAHYSPSDTWRHSLSAAIPAGQVVAVNFPDCAWLWTGGIEKLWFTHTEASQSLDPIKWFEKCASMSLLLHVATAECTVHSHHGLTWCSPISFGDRDMWTKLRGTQLERFLVALYVQMWARVVFQSSCEHRLYFWFCCCSNVAYRIGYSKCCQVLNIWMLFCATDHCSDLCISHSLFFFLRKKKG